MASASNKRSRTTRSTQSTQPPQQPDYEKFQDDEHAERFEKIKGFKFSGERRFDFINLQRYPQFETTIRTLGWKRLNDMVEKESNRTIALEFFANAFGDKDNVVYVRGKQIDYSPRAINAFLGLKPPRQCHVEMRRSRSSNNFPSDDVLQQILQEIGEEGVDYVRSKATGFPTRMDVVDLKPQYKAWASFIHSTLESVSATSELPMERLYILEAIIFGYGINVGRLINLSLKEMANCGTSVHLGHVCLINALCKKEGVPEELGDIMLKSKGAIDDTAMVKFEKKKGREGPPVQRERGGPSQAQPMQEDAPQYPPLHPMMLDYLGGMACWAQDTSSQLYVDGPYFGAELSLAADQHRQRSLQSNTFDRFGTEANMEDYIMEQRRRAGEREGRLRSDFARGKAVSDQRVNEFYADLQGDPEATDEDEQ
jgi:hypothetical protein